MPAVLTTSSYAHRTSPVLRGKWVMETLLDLPPPAPPADVGEIGSEESSESSESEAATLREQLEHHRSKPECAACHRRMDPIGFGLDGYDALGRWRGRGVPLAEYRGDFPDGTSFSGVNGLRDVLLQDERRLMRALTRRMLGFALGRALTWQDRPTVDAILERTEKEGGSAQAWLLAIVESDPFCYRSPAVTVAEKTP